jgi:hypothetical protein
MINRFTRILTRWLREHPELGLRAFLDATAFDSDAEATTLLLNEETLPITIYNDVDDECTAKDYDPDKHPALVIVAELSSDAPVRRPRKQMDFEAVRVSLAYMEKGTKVTHARQRGGYVLTAVMDSLRAFNEPSKSRIPIPTLDPEVTWIDTSPTWRQIGDIDIVELTQIRESRITGAVGKSVLIGTVLATFRVRRLTETTTPAEDA